MLVLMLHGCILPVLGLRLCSVASHVLDQVGGPGCNFVSYISQLRHCPMRHRVLCALQSSLGMGYTRPSLDPRWSFRLAELSPIQSSITL